MPWNKPRNIESMPIRTERVQEESRDMSTGRRLHKRTERQENATVVILAKGRAVGEGLPLEEDNTEALQTSSETQASRCLKGLVAISDTTSDTTMSKG